MSKNQSDSNETVRYSAYMTDILYDALNELMNQTNTRKNSLINLAVSKLLMEFGLISFDKEVIELEKKIKNTLPISVKKVSIGDNNKLNTIEKLRFKEDSKIRFGHYTTKKSYYNGKEHIPSGEEKLILRPLEVTEEDLLKLLDEALKQEVLSDSFKKQLKISMSNSE
ncbi:hypothetical protein SAMN05216232_2534 [Virgibacillus subterraneus]|uniref:Uncharacterized protein n=1 Tax=Virgibacillus subterraneus TaxID=621109 RepID=A0A1H9GAJ4_9BACI|nr:hypothetical protein [Virgibacillus subterraneus]SEQ47185.1 hypothetical protein SAMN05216232_2534 [Virgibacillus subterraneus]